MPDSTSLGLCLGVFLFFVPYILLWQMCNRIAPTTKRNGTTIDDYILRNGRTIEEEEKLKNETQ